MKPGFFLCLIAILISLVLGCFPARPVQASAPAQGPQSDWLERRTRNFAILYSRNVEAIATGLFSLYGDLLDQEYDRLTGLFGIDLPLPLSIRIYGDVIDYQNLNAMAPALDSTGIHTHLGDREICLIASKIIQNLAEWQKIGLDAIRYELAILFVNKLSNDKTPPGLAAAVGYYLQDPQNSLPPLLNQWNAAPVSARTLAAWRAIWESSAIQTDPLARLQAVSTVAYLAEQAGWAAFLSFLKKIPVSEGYRQALAQVSGRDLADLQTEWQNKYFTLYLAGRWRFNAAYNFDISQYTALVNGGAYSEAISRINEILPLMEATRQAEKKKALDDLLQKAQNGLEAGALRLQARQAYLDRQFNDCLRLTAQASEKYTSVGNPAYQAELDIYRKNSQQVLELRSELAILGAQVSQFQVDPGLAKRLREIFYSLDALGDSEGSVAAQKLLSQMGTRQGEQEANLGVIAGLLCLALLGLRIGWTFRRLPPEARL